MRFECKTFKAVLKIYILKNRVVIFKHIGTMNEFNNFRL